jgi:hypothetical protein
LPRLQQLLKRGLAATAPLWPELTIAHGWLKGAAYLLANPDGAARATVQARHAVPLADIEEEAASTPYLQALAAQFAKVTASYGSLVFTCYDIADLPRTNNDLEQLVGSLRHQLRRATGHKSAPASPVVCGATRLPAAVVSQSHSLTAEELATADLEQWRTARVRLEQRRQPRVLGRQFRQNPDAYLQALEEHWVKLSLPC